MAGMDMPTQPSPHDPKTPASVGAPSPEGGATQAGVRQEGGSGAGVSAAVIGRRVAAVCSLGAAAIHFGITGEHFAQWWAYGVFFILLGAFQVGWAVAAWVTSNRGLLFAAIAVNSGALVLWAVTRTTGLPFGPNPGSPEAIGVADLASGVLEAAVVAVLVVLAVLRRPARRVSGVTATAVTAVVGALVLGTAGVALAAPESSGSMSGGASMSGDTGNRMDMPNLPDVSKATAAQTAAAKTLLDQTRATIAAYEDPAKANADGYDIAAAIQKWHRKHPGRPQDAVIPALHVANDALRQDDHIADPTRPETVIYLRTKSGQLLLEGVMYTAKAPGKTTNATENPPDVAGPYTRWHFHEHCMPAGGHAKGAGAQATSGGTASGGTQSGTSKAGKQSKTGKKGKGGNTGRNATRMHAKMVHPNADGSCPSGMRLRKTGYMMHVWNVADANLVQAYAMTPPFPAIVAYAKAHGEIKAGELAGMGKILARNGAARQGGNGTGTHSGKHSGKHAHKQGRGTGSATGSGTAS